jgi:hypothetical protein
VLQRSLGLPSNAFTDHLEQLLLDAEELDDAHTELRTGNPGRQYGLASLNRAIVVMSVSAWEAYVEELIRESVRALRPPGPPFGLSWPPLNAYAMGLLSNFNTPNQVNVERLIRNCLGLADVHLSWAWQNCNSAQAVQRLTDAMNYRHQIAHGVNPRPIIHNHYASQLPSFFRRLARCTDDAVRHHLVNVHGLAVPWPP